MCWIIVSGGSHDENCPPPTGDVPTSYSPVKILIDKDRWQRARESLAIWHELMHWGAAVWTFRRRLGIIALLLLIGLFLLLLTQVLLMQPPEDVDKRKTDTNSNPLGNHHLTANFGTKGHGASHDPNAGHAEGTPCTDANTGAKEKDQKTALEPGTTEAQISTPIPKPEPTHIPLSTAANNPQKGAGEQKSIWFSFDSDIIAAKKDPALDLHLERFWKPIACVVMTTSAILSFCLLLSLIWFLRLCARADYLVSKIDSVLDECSCDESKSNIRYVGLNIRYSTNSTTEVVGANNNNLA